MNSTPMPLPGGPTVGALLAEAEPRLAAEGVRNPRGTAERLLAHALGVERYRLTLDVARNPPAESAAAFRSWVNRRAAGEPLQYILGIAEFMSLPFEVGPGVLVPRPETEILVETALAEIRALLRSDPAIVPFPLVADLGTGSGAVAVSVARYLAPAIVHATDVSEEALRMARANADRLGVARRVNFHAGDLFAPLEELGVRGNLAAVVCNPPYIPSGEIVTLAREVRDHEPHLALDGGPDGFAVMTRLMAEAPEWLRGGGFLAFELGAGQAPRALAMLAEDARWERAAAVKDYTGVERVIVAHRATEGIA